MNDEDRKTLETWRDVIDAFLSGKEVEYEHNGAWLRFAPGVLALLLRRWTTENDVLGDGRPRTPARVRVKREPCVVWLTFEEARDRPGAWVRISTTKDEAAANEWLQRSAGRKRKIARFVEDLNSEKNS